MSPVVSFHRKTRGSVRWGEGSDQRLFEIHLVLEKTVDPESGMTLNLVDVDRILSFLWPALDARSFSDTHELVLESMIYLDREIRAQSADIVWVDWLDPLTGERVQARAGNPATIWSWERQPARVFVKAHDRTRSGFIQKRVPWRPFAATAQVLELEVHSEREVCEKWAAQDAKAVEVLFQDELSHETWRWEK